MPFPKTILMIEDDAPTREVVRMACVGQNLNLIEAETGEKGMEMIEKSEPDLVILDLNLPGVSGMDVCRQLRADGTQVPVIMLTAKNDTIDVVVGLEVGADDYLTKPFEVRELLARVGAHLRRSEQAVTQAQPKTRFEFPGLIIDMNSRQVWRENQEVALTLTEFNLLSLWASPRKAALQAADSFGSVVITGTTGTVIALLFDAVVAAGFAGLGLAARKAASWAFIVGMSIYGLDALLLAWATDWLSVAFHGLALFSLQRLSRQPPAGRRSGRRADPARHRTPAHAIVRIRAHRRRNILFGPGI